MKKILTVLAVVLSVSVVGYCTFRDNSVPTEDELIEAAIEHDKMYGTDYSNILIERR